MIKFILINVQKSIIA